ncbi:Fic family protein [Streptococcus sp. 20-1249]|uniref:Fic family protein n=1 Tax=Streptococcus hepaticus TaxID=3349163 RepID=UPI0037489C02
MSELQVLKNKLASLRPLNRAELTRLREEFIIENTYNSNAIEGNTLTLRETALILQEGVTIAGKQIREHLEVVGYKDAFDYIVTLAEQDEILDARQFKDIHSLVLMNDNANRGRYRKVPVKILGSQYQTAQPDEIENRIEQLLKEYQQRLSEDIVSAICFLHLEFESIHPFIDGNGRTGRLLLNLELIKHGYLPVNIKFTDREKYYDAFDHYHQGQLEYFVQMVSQYEKEELEKYIAILEGIEHE